MTSKFPMAHKIKPINNSTGIYVPAAATDIRETFKRVTGEGAKRQARVAMNVAILRERSRKA